MYVLYNFLKYFSGKKLYISNSLPTRRLLLILNYYDYQLYLEVDRYDLALDA